MKTIRVSSMKRLSGKLIRTFAPARTLASLAIAACAWGVAHTGHAEEKEVTTAYQEKHSAMMMMGTITSAMFTTVSAPVMWPS